MRAVHPILPVVLRCDPRLRSKVRYVFDTLLLAAGWVADYVQQPPRHGPWLLYAAAAEPDESARARCVAVTHCPAAWTLFDGQGDIGGSVLVDGLPVVLGGDAGSASAGSATDMRFDLPANAFYFLSAWSERAAGAPRRLYAHSVYQRLELPQDIVDRYLALLVQRVQDLRRRHGWPAWPGRAWPGEASHAVVLSHDVDFLPRRPAEVLAQAARTLMRHLLKQRDPVDAWRAALACLGALARRRDPFCDLEGIIEQERLLGVRSSFQVAVARRHPQDVNYPIEDPRVRQRLKVILASGFDLCLHGSVRSTERPGWYEEEAATLALHLATALGSRQHFLSFAPDALFAAQERAGIRYDMSMGYPDRTGPRTGCSFPYFPYCLAEDRPYRVLQIGLCLMDVTLRSYMGLKGERAWRVIHEALQGLRSRRGAASVVWHPIVFQGARDPGFDALYWRLVHSVLSNGGWATDGRALDAFWREQAAVHPSFVFAGGAARAPARA